MDSATAAGPTHPAPRRRGHQKGQPHAMPTHTTDTRIAAALGTTLHRRSLVKSLAGIGAAALSITAIAPALANHTEQDYTVSSNANFRSGPGTTYSIIGVVTKGAIFKINGQVQNGYAGIIYQGKTGWVLASLIVAAGASSPVITGKAWTISAVNLRSGPGTSYAVLRVVPYAAQVGTSTTIKNAFVYVSYNGQVGWIAGAYLSATNPDDQGGNYGTATANVNLRSEPSTASTILAVVPKGAKVQLLHTQAGDFLNVNYNGRQGWVHKAYIAV